MSEGNGSPWAAGGEAAEAVADAGQAADRPGAATSYSHHRQYEVDPHNLASVRWTLATALTDTINNILEPVSKVRGGPDGLMTPLLQAISMVVGASAATAYGEARATDPRFGALVAAGDTSALAVDAMRQVSAYMAKEGCPVQPEVTEAIAAIERAHDQLSQAFQDHCATKVGEKIDV